MIIQSYQHCLNQVKTKLLSTSKRTSLIQSANIIIKIEINHQIKTPRLSKKKKREKEEKNTIL